MYANYLKFSLHMFTFDFILKLEILKLKYQNVKSSKLNLTTIHEFRLFINLHKYEVHTNFVIIHLLSDIKFFLYCIYCLFTF